MYIRLNEIEKGLNDRVTAAENNQFLQYVQLEMLKKECESNKRLNEIEREKLILRLEDLDRRMFYKQDKRIEGCFHGDTHIQVSATGETLPVWKITNGSQVWNPSLLRLVTVKRAVAGPETGYMLAITTSGKTVQVTKTHPMKVLTKVGGWQNVPACDLVNGTWTVTNEGNERVIGIQMIPILESLMVYNFEFDLDSSVPDWERTVVANGIHTLDLYAQVNGMKKKKHNICLKT